jgi:hypothetical protein
VNSFCTAVNAELLKVWPLLAEKYKKELEIADKEWEFWCNDFNVEYTHLSAESFKVESWPNTQRNGTYGSFRLYIPINFTAAFSVNWQEMPSCCAIALLHNWSGIPALVPLAADFLLHISSIFKYKKVQVNVAPSPSYPVQKRVLEHFNKSTCSINKFISTRTQREIVMLVTDSVELQAQKEIKDAA